VVALVVWLSMIVPTMFGPQPGHGNESGTLGIEPPPFRV